MVPTPAVDKTAVPFMNQIAMLPVATLRKRMSLIPSPLKSPVSAIIQSLDTTP
jgi:hypothetical protein